MGKQKKNDNVLIDMINSKIIAGYELHEKGNLQQAKKIYEEVLTVNPNCFDALRLLGNIYAELGDIIIARNLLYKALDMDNINPYLLNSLANVEYELDNFQDSLKLYDRAIQIKSDLIEAHNGKANVYLKLELPEAAIEHLKKCIFFDSRNHLHYFNLGLIFGKIGRLDDAINYLKSSIDINNSYSPAYFNLANCYYELNNLDGAVSHLEQAIELEPANYQAIYNLGNIYIKLKKFNEAIKKFEYALMLNLSFPEAWYNRGVALSELNLIDDAVKSYDKAINLDNLYKDAYYNKSLLLLRSRNFDLGWELYEWRLKKIDIPNIANKKPKWNGKKSEKKLLLWSEQGLGDVIVFASIFKELELFPQIIYVAIDIRIKDIFTKSFPKLIFLDKKLTINEDICDDQLSIASLGLYFRNDTNSFSKSQIPYLVASKPSEILLSQILKFSNKKRCGISWKSNNTKVGESKSLMPNDLIPLLKIEGFNFINLQYGHISSDIHNICEAHTSKINILTNVDLFNDIDSLFSLINSCDLVITTSNVTAHISGALGKETLLLVPFSSGKFWYWEDFDGRSIVYPTIKIFTQKIQGDWTVPISELIHYVENNYLIE